MSIKRVSLRNFKCFEELDIQLSKITLLTGKNSSGKSSFVDAILAIFQSEFPFYLSPNGKYVDMGDFPEVVFDYDRERDISLNISIGLGRGNSIEYQTIWGYDLKTKMPVLKNMDVESGLYKLAIKEKGNKYLFNFNLKERKYKKSERYKLDKVVSDFIESISNLLEKEEQEAARSFKGGLEIKNVVDFSFNNIETLRDELSKAGNAFATMQLSDCSMQIATVERNLNYIGAFRIQPERTYYRKAKLLDKVGKFGDNYIDLILGWKDNMSPEYKELVRILRDVKMLHAIRFRKSSGGRFEPRVKINDGGVWSSLIDVGFGISQLLPIIVADLQMPKGSTLIVAQPEMHLHTSAQADFASYFIKQVNERNKRYILETHSEYILNRIRAAIVKGVIGPKDVSVYYFDNSVDGSKCYKINLTKDGQVKGAPKEFFDTYQVEVMDIALNT